MASTTISERVRRGLTATHFWFLLVSSIPHLLSGDTGVIPADTGVVPVAEEFLVNSYTTSRQSDPALAMAPSGDFVVVWTSDGSHGDDTESTGVQGQRYSSGGIELGSQFQVNSYNTGAQFGADIAMTPNGDFVVVWTSNGSSGGDTESASVQGQRYSSDGIPLGTQFQVNAYTPRAQRNPRVVVDENGDFVVVWFSTGLANYGGVRHNIQGQRYSSDGSTISSRFTVHQNIYEYGPDGIAMATDGEFLVVWNAFPGTTSSIQARRYSREASPLGSQFRVNTEDVGFNYAGEVATRPHGGFAFAWNRSHDTIDSVQYQRFSFHGNPIDTQLQVNTTFGDDPSGSVDIGTNSDGGSVVVWRTRDVIFAGGPPANYVPGIHGRRVSSDDGPPDYSQFFVDVDVDDGGSVDFGRPVVAVDERGDFVVVWDRDGNIYGRKFCSDDDVDGVCNRLDTCLGDNASGDTDGDGICDDIDACDSADAANLCLHNDRFKVDVQWRDFEGHSGSGQRVGFNSEESGLFWFFNSDNWEVLVKVIDGCHFNDHFWVFSAATTNVEFAMRVTDTETQQTREYFNPLGEAAPAITDTSALATCP